MVKSGRNGTNAPRYDFERESLTASELEKKYPAWTRDTFVKAHEQGCRTVADMHERDRRGAANIRAAARKNGKKSPRICAEESDQKRATYRHDINGMGLSS